MATASISGRSPADALNLASDLSQLARWVESARATIGALRASREQLHAAALANTMRLPSWDEPISAGLDALLHVQNELIAEAKEARHA